VRNSLITKLVDGDIKEDVDDFRASELGDGLGWGVALVPRRLLKADAPISKLVSFVLLGTFTLNLNICVAWAFKTGMKSGTSVLPLLPGDVTGIRL
jgi:hypothetical protein